MTTMIKFLCTVAISLFCTIVIFSQDDGCADVLIYAGGDISFETQEQVIARYIYDNHCQSSGSSRATGLSLGVEDLFESLSFGFSSKKANLKSFCDTYEENYATRNRYSRESSIAVRSAIKAWENCKMIAERGIKITPNLIQTTMFSIAFARDDVDLQSILGFEYDSTILTCHGTIDNEYVTLGPSIKKKLENGDTWTATCKRIPITISEDSKFYPKAEIIAKTTSGNLALTIPQDQQLPVMMASELEDRIDSLTEMLADQEKSTLQSFSGSGKKIAYGSTSINDWLRYKQQPNTLVWKRIDLSSYNFSPPPLVVVSHAGKNAVSHLTHGIYNVSKDGFRIFVYDYTKQLNVSTARNEKGMYINWIAIGE